MANDPVAAAIAAQRKSVGGGTPTPVDRSNPVAAAIATRKAQVAASPNQPTDTLDRILNKTVHAESKIFDILGRPGHIVTSAARAGAQQLGNKKGFSKLVANFSPSTIAAEASGAIRGARGKEHFTPTEALFGAGAKPKGKAGAVADFIASVATDPTTLIGLGGSQVGAKVAEEAVLRQAAEQAAEKTAPRLLTDLAGTEAAGLSTSVAKDTARKAAEAQTSEVLRTQGAKAAINSVGKEKVVGELQAKALQEGIAPRRSLLGVIKGEEKGGQAGAERFANRSLGALERQTGLPETAIGRATLPYEIALKDFVGKGTTKLGNTAPIKFLDATFNRDSDLQRAFGPNITKQVTESRGLSNAEKYNQLSNAKATLDAIEHNLSETDKLRVDKAAAEPLYALQLKLESPQLAHAAEQKKNLVSSLQKRWLDAGVIKPEMATGSIGANTNKDILQQVGRSEQAVASQKHINELTKLKDPTTGQGLILSKDNIETLPKGYEPVRLHNGQEAVVHPAIAKDVKRTEKILTDSNEVKKLGEVYNQWEKWWRTGATTLVPTGFTPRNARSNFILNWFGGVTNPANYKEAGAIQKAARKALSAPSAREAIANGKIEEVLKSSMKPEDYKLYKEAKLHDVLSSSFFTTDTASLGGKSKAATVVNKGRDFNQWVENNARLAHYISKRKEGATAAEAADSVKKWLFDYDNLSPAEKKVFKRFNSFYTFQRKNLPRQFESLLTQTGKFTARQHAVEHLTGEPNLGENPPNYLRGSRALPANIAALLGIKNIQALTQPDYPLEAAGETTQPLLGTLASIPGIKEAIPTGYRPQSGGELARSYLQQSSGPIPSLAKYFGGEATGKDLFTGYNVKPGGTNATLRLLNALTPATTKGQSFVKGDYRQRLLKALFGLGVRPNPTQQ